jgi:hypothetical protein
MLEEHRPKNILSKNNFNYNKFVSQISLYELRNVLLVGFDKLTIKNDSGIKWNHSGSNHCNVFLKTHNNVSMRKYATLYDLATAYYKLKLHKWDNKYEKFCYAETTMCVEDVEVSLVFGYGL